MSLASSWKRPFKRLSSLIPMDVYQRMLTFSIIKKQFPRIADIPVLPNRQELWNYTIETFLGCDLALTYVEFGVWQGESIKYFAAQNSNQRSRFYGFDSFEGLPEHWGAMAKGTFDQRGAIPETTDGRIKFIKGWFQDSWDGSYPAIRDSLEATLAVHYDADLYSSTLFALTKVDGFKKAYVAIFDEFTGHETRALYNYCEAYGASVEPLARTALGIDSTLPAQLLCRIKPRNCASS